MSNNNDSKDLIDFFVAIFALIAFVFLVPILTYWCGYLDGWIAMKTIGDPLIDSINSIFGTSFLAADLPKIGGVLGWIGGFFKAIDTSKN